MQIIKKTSKKPFIIATIVVTLLTIAIAAYIYVFNGNILGWNNRRAPQSGTTSDNINKPTNDQVEAGETIKEESVDTGNGKVNTPPSSVSSDGTGKQNVELTVTAVNQSQDTLQIRTQIAKVVSTGTCNLVMSKFEQIVTKNVGVQNLASTSTCKGFDIPVSELSSGSWNVKISYENDSLIGNASTVITVE